MPGGRVREVCVGGGSCVGHTHDVLVESKGGLVVFYTDHGVILRTV